MLLSLVLGIALSLAAATLGGALWSRMPGSQDRVFADLMLWGWLRRSVDRAPPGPGARAARKRPAQALSHRVADRPEQAARSARRLHPRPRRSASPATRSASLARWASPRREVAKVATAAAVHDVGKIYTPREILNNPRALTEANSRWSSSTRSTARRW